MYKIYYPVLKWDMTWSSEVRTNGDLAFIIFGPTLAAVKQRIEQLLETSALFSYSSDYRWPTVDSI